MNFSTIPFYQSHKKVRGFKIKEIKPRDNSTGHWLIPTDPKIESVAVDSFFVRGKEAVVGGYFVVYEDGYCSFSPAKAFEEGYTLIEDLPPMATHELTLHILDKYKIALRENDDYGVKDIIEEVQKRQITDGLDMATRLKIALGNEFDEHLYLEIMKAVSRSRKEV